MTGADDDYYLDIRINRCLPLIILVVCLQRHAIRDGLANTNVMKYKLTVLAIPVLLIACSQEQNGVLGEYISRGNADADIALTIFDNKTFKMHMEIFNATSENDVIFYIGK